MDSIFAVIVNYNTQRDTKECLESLSKINQKNFKLTTLVVDNGSKEPLEIPSKFLNAGVEVLRSETNLGFTGGSNLGINEAIERNADYIFLLNSDTTIHPEALNQLYLFLRKDSTIGAVCPKIYFSTNREFHTGYQPTEKGKILWYAGGSIDWPNLAAFHRGVDEVDRGQFDATQECDFLTGCALLIPTQVIKRAGLLSEDYFLYLEDVDFSLRLKETGYKLMYYPQAVVWHKNAGSSGGAGSITHQYYQNRNRLLLGWRFGDNKVKLTVLRVIMQILDKGTNIERLAVWHFLTSQLGKQHLV